MPSWFTLDFVAANWQPLLVALILGYILGWLFTGIPNKRHANEAEDRAASADARARKTERELTDVRREAEQNKSRAAAVQVDLDSAQARIRELETPPPVDVENATAAEEEIAVFPDARGVLPAEEVDGAALFVEIEEEVLPYDGDAELQAEEWEVVAAEALSGDDETQTMLIPAAEGPWESHSTAENEVSAAFSDTAQSPDLSGLTTSKDIALTEAYARVTTLQSELDRNDALLRTRQADVDALRAELAAANANRHELETRLIRAREDVASELAVLASTMIKMKDEALLRADSRIAALTSELEGLRSAPRTTAAALPKPPVQIGEVGVPQATSAGWTPGPYIPDVDESAATSGVPEMAKAVKAMAEESTAQANETATSASGETDGSSVPPGLNAVVSDAAEDAVEETVADAGTQSSPEQS